MFLLLDSIDARLTIVDCANNRTTVTMDQFLAMDMHQRVLYNVLLPRFDPNTLFRSYKIMIRAQNAHAYVNAGFKIRLNGDRVESARLCYGGIDPSFTHASSTEAMLIDRNLYTNETLQAALVSLHDEVQPDWILPDASPEYRKQLALALFYRFFLSTCPMEKLNALHVSGRQAIERFVSSGTQSFLTFETKWPLTKPVPKYEGIMQASGEGKYINDLATQDGELWAAFAIATKVNAHVVKLDAGQALVFDEPYLSIK